MAIEGRGSFVNMVFFGLFVGWLLVYSTEAAQCKPDVINPCIFRCNGTSFDLSKAFNFPIKVTETKPRYVGDSPWYYLWSPCEPQLCDSLSDSELETKQAPADLHWIAVCQKGPDFVYGCGRSSKPVLLTTDDGWRIEYTFGHWWRISMFDFVMDKIISEPNITFVSEDPFLQYNFKVTGNCIGQDTVECRQVYNERKKQQLYTVAGSVSVGNNFDS